MVVRLLVLAILLCACDVVFRLDDLNPRPDGATTDATTDGTTGQWGPWSMPTQLANLNSTQTESDASLTADLLTIYFTSDRSGVSRPYRATRETRADDFGSPQVVSELDAAQARIGQVSGDNRRFYYNKLNTANGTEDIYEMSRDDDAQQFTTSIHLDMLSSTLLDRNPAVADNELVAVITRVESLSDNLLYMYERADVAAPWTGRSLMELETPHIDSAAHLSADGLVLVFHSDRLTQNGLTDLYMTTRPAVGMTFAPPMLLLELSSPEKDADPYISPDLTTMVFGRDTDLWISMRERR